MQVRDLEIGSCFSIPGCEFVRLLDFNDTLGALVEFEVEPDIVIRGENCEVEVMFDSPYGYISASTEVDPESVENDVPTVEDVLTAWGTRGFAK